MIQNGVDSSYQLQFENSYASIGKVNGPTDHRLILTSSGEDFVLPGTDGASTEVLTTDGSGILSWSAPGGASSVQISQKSDATDYNLVFTEGNGKKPLNIDTNNNILYNPSTNLLTVSGLYTTGDVSVNGNITGDLTGNASTAAALDTSRNIAGVPFNGTSDIDITLNNLNDVVISDVSTGNILVYNGTNWVNDVSFTGDLTGNASTATALDTSRNIAGVPFNGTSDIDITLNNLNDVVISSVTQDNILVYNGTNWVNDVSFTGNVTGNLNGNIENTTGNLKISSADISLNATNDIQMNSNDDIIMNATRNINMDNGRSKIKFNNSNGDIEIDVSQNLVMVPDNGIIDLSGHTFARKNVIQQGMIIDYVTTGGSHDLSTNDILFGFTHICSSGSAMTLTVPSLSDVLSAVDANTGISSLSTGTVFPLSYIVNNSGNKDITVDTSDTSITIYNGTINASTNATFTYMMTGDASAAIIIT
jgi:hypothetical protein